MSHRGEVPSVVVTGFDHLVLRCGEVERTLAWYCDVLGLAGVRVDEWRRGEVPFPSARIDAATIIDFVAGNVGGRDHDDAHLDHLCLVVDSVDLAAVAASGRFEVVDGPGPRFGARGQGTSLYVRDPDGLTVELRCY